MFPNNEEYYYADDESPIMGTCDIANTVLEDELEYIELGRRRSQFMPVSFPDSQMHYHPSNLEQEKQRREKERKEDNQMMDYGKEKNNIDELIINMQNIDIGLGVANLWMYSSRTRLVNASYCYLCNTVMPVGSDFYFMKCEHGFCRRCTEQWFEIKSFCPICSIDMKLIA
jgi:hypothetical protein